MLVIREEQIQSFMAADDGEIAKIAAEAIRGSNPDRVSGHSESRLRSMARIGVERARAAGFSKAEDIAVFVSLMFEVSPQFNEQPAIANVLQNTALAPTDRFEQIFEQVPDDAWTEAQDLYDEKIWFPQAG
jgi:hypothetical protein